MESLNEKIAQMEGNVAWRIETQRDLGSHLFVKKLDDQATRMWIARYQSLL
ncbi:hypothetical protein HZA99_04220 [Candidatus Woesearchaeota archaeon]|nr:hypothetical protein [Candidatus Woesearchaeota archaeon]